MGLANNTTKKITSTLTNNKGKTALGLFIVVVFMAGAAFSQGKQVAPVSWCWFGDDYAGDGLALQGYDPVAYFEGEAKMGDEAFSTEHAGRTWRFSSQAHQSAFIRAPGDYARERIGHANEEKRPSAFLRLRSSYFGLHPRL